MIPPYRAQWESAGLVAEFLAGRDAATDPLWRNSGATSAAEYARWSHHLCGAACLQMALGARGRPVPPIHAVRRGVQAEGGYVETPKGDTQGDLQGDIRGLIYAGANAWLAAQGLHAETVLDLDAADLPRLLATPGALFIASVHPGIRRPAEAAPSRGGHLILCFGVAADGAIRFHNPSGDTPASQADARIAPDTLKNFFAGRGILIP